MASPVERRAGDLDAAGHRALVRQLAGPARAPGVATGEQRARRAGLAARSRVPPLWRECFRARAAPRSESRPAHRPRCAGFGAARADDGVAAIQRGERADGIQGAHSGNSARGTATLSRRRLQARRERRGAQRIAHARRDCLPSGSRVAAQAVARPELSAAIARLRRAATPSAGSRRSPRSAAAVRRERARSRRCSSSSRRCVC